MYFLEENSFWLRIILFKAAPEEAAFIHASYRNLTGSSSGCDFVQVTEGTVQLPFGHIVSFLLSDLFYQTDLRLIKNESMPCNIERSWKMPLMFCNQSHKLKNTRIFQKLHYHPGIWDLLSFPIVTLARSIGPFISPLPSLFTDNYQFFSWRAVPGLSESSLISSATVLVMATSSLADNSAP